MLDSNFINDLLTSFLVSTINYNPESDSIDLISGDFKNMDLKLKVKSRIDNLYLIKDKLLKQSFIKIIDTSFAFIDNKYITFIIVVSLYDLKDFNNKPVVAELDV